MVVRHEQGGAQRSENCSPGVAANPNARSSAAGLGSCSGTSWPWLSRGWTMKSNARAAWLRGRTVSIARAEQRDDPAAAWSVLHFHLADRRVDL